MTINMRSVAPSASPSAGAGGGRVDDPCCVPSVEARDAHRREERGVTMHEMLVVVAILAVIGAVAVGSVTRSRQAGQFQAALDLVAAELGRERTEAATRGETRTWEAERLARSGTLGSVRVGEGDAPPGFTSVRRVTFEGATGRLAASEPGAVAVVVAAGGAAGAVTVTRSGILQVLVRSGEAWKRR